jgi:hypothetical protein
VYPQESTGQTDEAQLWLLSNSRRRGGSQIAGSSRFIGLRDRLATGRCH